MSLPAPVAYDPAWPELFEAERTLLERALAPWLAGGVHHVGSTAVPGLLAKPVIDMIAGVRDLEEARAASEPLRALGYEYREHRPEAHLFVQPGKGVHLTEPGSDLWRERLAFRDALRRDAALALAYAEWKLEHAAEDGPAAGPYTEDKRAFVQAALAPAGIVLKPDEERLAPAVLCARRGERP